MSLLIVCQRKYVEKRKRGGLLMDPVTAMATASAAFGAIKKGFQIGRDIESMASDLSRWMGAMSDLDMLEKGKPKTHPYLKNCLRVSL